MVFSLTRPWGELQRAQLDLDGFFGNGSMHSTPWIRFQAHEQGARAEVELPGFAPEDVQVDVRGSLLTIQGKRPARGMRAALEFEKSFELSFPVQEDKVAASLKQGVLEIELPRAEADKPKRVAIRGE